MDVNVIIKRGKAIYEAMRSIEQEPSGNEQLLFEACNALQKLQAENRWIPVDERLPEKTGEYLVLPYHKHCPFLWYQDGWYWYDQQDDAISETLGHNSDEPIFEVTHWKLIPPKP